MEKIAVVVPVFNVEQYLRRCVDSILSQSLNDFVLVLVDDGSTDGSRAICDEYCARDGRIRLIRQGNAGQSAARNAALDMLDEDRSVGYVTFVDSDDWVMPTYLEELAKGISSGADVASVPSFRFVDGDTVGGGGRSVVWQTLPPREYWLVPGQCQSAAWGKLYALRLFGGIRFPVGKICEDEATNYRLFFKAKKVAYSQTPLYAYCVRSGSTMHSPWSVRRMDRLDAWRDQIRFFSEMGFPELVANSRKWLVVDLVDAVRNLRSLGDAERAESCRRSLAAELKAGRFPFAENYLAYKTAHPLRAKLMRPLTFFAKASGHQQA